MSTLGMIRITVYAGPAARGGREASTVEHVVDDRDVHEQLRLIGLEWKTADYFHERQVVITLDPIPTGDSSDVRLRIREAADALERTGLL